MEIEVRLSSTLRDYVAGYDPEAGMAVSIAENTSALDLANRLGLPPKKIKFVMLNGKHAPVETILRAGDRLAYFPAVGGG